MSDYTKPLSKALHINVLHIGLVYQNSVTFKAQTELHLYYKYQIHLK